MIVACSACNHRFEGGGYRDETCPACGAIASRTRACPCCRTLLVARRAEDIVIDHCTQCGGVFVDHVTLQRSLERPQWDTLLVALPREATPAHGRPPPRCATCGQDMAKRLWSGGSGVIVDVCAPHGVYFDPGELHRLVEHGRREAREAEARRRADAEHASRRQYAEWTGLADLVELIQFALSRRDKE